MTDRKPETYTSFHDHKRIACGSLRHNALALKAAMLSGAQGTLWTFCDQTGRVIDLDMRGSDAEILARLPPEQDEPPQSTPRPLTAAATDAPRSRGRPKLGVVAREVTLLARHWEWLATQEGGASVTLRKLVEQARQANAQRDRQRQACECAYHVMSAMAGDLAGFEEATRALFANDAEKFHQQTQAWPADIRAYVSLLADGQHATSAMPPQS